MERHSDDQVDCIEWRENKFDKLLGLSRSRSSSHSFSSDPLDSTELDDFVEEDVWEADKRDPDMNNISIRHKTAIIKTIIPEINGSSFLGLSDIAAFDAVPKPATGPLKAVVRAVSNSPTSMTGFPPSSFIHSYVDMRAKDSIVRRSNRDVPKHVPTSRLIPRGRQPEIAAGVVIHQSAPVNIPDWSKILNIEKQRKAYINDLDDAYKDSEERLPPHQLLARDYARTQISSLSVFEGAGRTLKGRDMSRVRDAVYTQTGFPG